jgi:FtsZ-binding cell division protein ZapB
MQFLSELAEENDRLEEEIKRVRSHAVVLTETNQELRKTISEWKAKVRKLKKEGQ